MQDLNDLFYFAQIVEHGGFSAAARALGMPKSRLSRRILALEERLGVRLLQRSTRRLSVTDIGREYYAHCVAMMVEAEAAQETIERARAEPQGALRIACPPALVCFQVGEMLARFMAANPRVAVELLSASRPVDLIAEGVDLALRVRFPPLAPSELVMRILGDSPQRLVASPALVAQYGAPATPADLSALPSLDLATPKHQWMLEGPDGATVRIAHAPRLVTDDMSQLLYAAQVGVGVAQLPSMVADASIADGRLLQVLPDWRAPSGVIHAIFASRRGLLPSVRSLIDHLAAEFGAASKSLAN